MRKQDIYDIQFAPEFDTFSLEAIRSCVSDCAVKFSQVISADSIDKLNGRASYLPHDVERAVPEIGEFLSIFEANALGYKKRKNEYDTEEVFPFTEGELPCPTSHTDSGNYNGFSLLVPLSGHVAFFGASMDRFSVYTPPPSFMAVYGPGDAILIRQDVCDRATGEKKDQVHHLGVSSGVRRLLFVDVEVSAI